MKFKIILATVATTVISSNAFALDANFSDAAWDGSKIPEGSNVKSLVV